MSRIVKSSILVVLLAAGCAGEDGISSLTNITDEPAGTNCADGGVRIDTGPDDDGDGSLASDEISATEYVCAGADAISTLTAVTPEAIGTNCTTGGVRITTGPDTNSNGTLDSAEVATTNYVCGAGDAQVVKAFISGSVAANQNAPVSLLGVPLTTTSPGEVFAIATADAFCTAAECPAGTPAAAGTMWIADNNLMVAPIAEFDAFHLQTALTESITRTARFPVAAAGLTNFYVRGEDTIANFTFYRIGITVVFIP